LARSSLWGAGVLGALISTVMSPCATLSVCVRSGIWHETTGQHCLGLASYYYGPPVRLQQDGETECAQVAHLSRRLAQRGAQICNLSVRQMDHDHCSHWRRTVDLDRLWLTAQAIAVQKRQGDIVGEAVLAAGARHVAPLAGEGSGSYGRSHPIAERHIFSNSVVHQTALRIAQPCASDQSTNGVATERDIRHHNLTLVEESVRDCDDFSLKSVVTTAGTSCRHLLGWFSSIAPANKLGVGIQSSWRHARSSSAGYVWYREARSNLPPAVADPNRTSDRRDR
jgi:hypothetical protein